MRNYRIADCSFGGTQNWHSTGSLALFSAIKLLVTSHIEHCASLQTLDLQVCVAVARTSKFRSSLDMIVAAENFFTSAHVLTPHPLLGRLSAADSSGRILKFTKIPQRSCRVNIDHSAPTFPIQILLEAVPNFSSICTIQANRYTKLFSLNCVSSTPPSNGQTNPQTAQHLFFVLQLSMEI